MNFKCLILDHDDTAVDSTASVHFPAHLEVMRRLRPDYPIITLNTWFEKNFSPGIMNYLTEEIGLNKKEMDEEYQIWQEFNAERNPPFYAGLPELMFEFVQQGGIIAVVSHSTEEHIKRHYEKGAPEVVPDFIFGWEHNPEHRKPSPWPVLQILEQTGLKPEEVLVVDDLKPGVEMAKAAGVPVAAAGWGHSITSIRKAMMELCDIWLPDIEALRTQIFS
ncbi:MAG: HAD family phosphatase [Spirochaetaceae bacterium]|nr:HAD family phosphatase [Spirochaetaceae bacterium]